MGQRGLLAVVGSMSNSRPKGGLTQIVIEDFQRVLEPLHSLPLERR